MQTVGAHAEALPFPDNSFERILMVDAFHHLIDQPAAAGELWRALKPGGTLVIEEPDIRKWPVKVVALAEKIALMRSHFRSPDRILNLFSGGESRIQVVREGYNAWIVIEKDPV
jgi:demethylmenaquinone methyltransferase/2-methoxy-6-polyprenyl-1,4-benzoquinol methylase